MPETLITRTSLIEGRATDSKSGESLTCTNPSNGQPVYCVPVGCSEDVNDAVRSARAAFERADWRDAPASTRKRVLHNLAALIESNARQLNELDAADMGKPVAEAFGSSVVAGALMRFSAEAVDKIMGDVWPSDRHSLAMQRRVPRGVVAAVVPWNFPACNAVLKVGPALAAGNSVVLKPSELSSRSAIRIAELALEAGIPPGVFNVVLGQGKTTGRSLAAHMDVDMLAFTGSTEVGKLMMQYAGGSNLKAVLAECGGKCPQIVFADGVDVKAAATSVASFILINQGQTCSVGSRVLVQRSIEEEFVEIVVSEMRKITIGDALSERTTFGPVVSEAQCNRVMHYIEGALAEKATLMVGGSRTLTDTGGYFVEPTVFRNVTPRMAIAREEVFGPVLAITAFDSEAQAIEIANSTIYGLAAYAWTADLSRGIRLAKGIRSPIYLNAAAPAGEGPGFAATYEPAGQSGLGAEGGLAGLESYTRRQLIWINHA
jgi:acyl-CoA reductase-like NAD-dependent aldehyde dehydrogenase